MKKKMNNFLSVYIKENRAILAILLFFFIIGILAGAFTVNTLNSMQKGDLYAYINGFLELQNIKITQIELFGQIFLNYAKLVLILWFLGVTIIGMPLIVGVIGFKGFATGFTVGFMIDVFTDLRGILVILSSIVPQSLIILPCIIILSVSSIKFSLFLLNQKSQKKFRENELKIRLISHTAISVLMLVIIAVGALLESLILPFFISIVWA